MNLRKVLFCCFVLLASGFGGRWEETERINLPQGLLLKDFVRDYNGDIYLV